MKRLLALLISLIFAASLSAAPKQIKPLKGFQQKVYNSSFSLYASSEMASIHDKFICTVTTYQKLSDGYLLVGAGHCTSANPELPPDMTYKVSEDIGLPLSSVTLLKSAMTKPLDYAVYFFPTKMKYPVIALGDESADRIGDKTLDVNFSLGATKLVSNGVISSLINRDTNSAVNGFYLVTQFDSHGASGSAVVSEKTHKIIGLVIAGWDGATMPSIVEPITVVEQQLEHIDALIAIARVSSISIVAPQTQNEKTSGGDPTLFQEGRGNHRARGGSHGGSRDSRGHRSDGRRLDRNTHGRIDYNRDVRERRGHREIFFGGLWFSCNRYGWAPWVFTDDIYVEMVGPDVYVIYSYNNPARQIEVFVEE